jgi:hypothetical protein
MNRKPDNPTYHSTSTGPATDLTHPLVTQSGPGPIENVLARARVLWCCLGCDYEQQQI